MTRRFNLIRDVDTTGISGTGHVAWGVQFPDGACVVRWKTKVTSCAFYAHVDDVIAIHGHNGATRLQWLD